MFPIGLIVAVISVSGALGGLMNSFTTPKSDTSPIPVWQHVIIGVGAAFVIPLFLNSISANLITEIIGKDDVHDYSKLLVLVGFCILAAVASKKFLDTLSDKIFSEIAKNRENIQSVSEKTDVAATDANTAKASATRAEIAVAPLIEEDAPAVSAPNANFAEAPASSELPDDERAILGAATNGKFSMRSLSGLKRDSKLPDTSSINSIISNLIIKGLLAQTTSSSGQPRWYATTKGRQLMAGVQQ